MNGCLPGRLNGTTYWEPGDSSLVFAFLSDRTYPVAGSLAVAGSPVFGVASYGLVQIPYGTLCVPDLSFLWICASPALLQWPELHSHGADSRPASPVSFYRSMKSACGFCYLTSRKGSTSTYRTLDRHAILCDNVVVPVGGLRPR